MKHNYRVKGLVAALALAGLASVAQAAVDDAALLADAGNNWVHTNGNLAGWRYSTLDKINASNAGKLRVAWVAQVGAKTDSQATPSVVDGVIYFPQDNKVFAIDGATGKTLWKYEHKLPDDWGGYNVSFFTGKHRGLAVSGGNVYFASNDAKLHAIDMTTGKAKWVKGYEGFDYPKDFAKSKDSNGYCITVGPTAIPGGLIVLPMNATDTGGLPGYVIGVSAETGDRTLVRRLVHDKFSESYAPTIGVDVSSYVVADAGPRRDQPLELVIWDVDGNFGLTVFRHVYVKGSAAALIIGDLTRPPTIAHMARLAEGWQDAMPGLPFELVINKCDDGVDRAAIPLPPRLQHTRTTLLTTSAKTGEQVRHALRRRLIG